MAVTDERLAVARRRRLVRRLVELRIDALLVTAPANVRYLSGFTGEDSALVVGRRWAALVTDGRFAAQAQRECPTLQAHIRRGGMAQALATVLRGRRVRRLGLEAEHATLEFQDKLSQVVSAGRLMNTLGLVTELRARKDAAEVAAIRRAVRIAEQAFSGMIAGGAKALVGRTEAQVAGELEYRMRQLGAEGPSFPSIVAAGKNAALPHYRPGSLRVRRGQPVLIDWGAKASGYCSDLTRVIFIGTIPPQIGRVYELVLAAQKAGIAAVRAGRPVQQVDAAAREVIAQAGFAEQFSHGLGHGIGLEIHEAPAVSWRNGQKLQAGQVVTVEPGIYLSGVGGVRIEDDVLVRAGEALVLSSLSKELRAMVLR
jgi:Xaa-Pro aminopeptidase